MKPPCQAFSIASGALWAVDMHFAIGQGLVVVDALVVDSVERQLVIGFSAVGVDDRAQLDMVQIVQDRTDQVLAVTALGEDDPRRRDTEPEQTRYLTAVFRRRLVARPLGTMVEQLAATLALTTPVGAALVIAVVASGTLDVPVPRPAPPRHIDNVFGGRITDLLTPI